MWSEAGAKTLGGIDVVTIDIPPLKLDRLSRFVVELGPPMSLGQGPSGERRIIPIVGGHFEGPVLRGTVLPGGADWQVVHADGMASIDTRYTLQTHDGALIYVSTRGVRHGPAEVLARLARGDQVDFKEYYFRIAVQLETGMADYLWVNRRVFVACAARLRDTVVYDLYALI
jgi:hypothetical protein